MTTEAIEAKLSEVKIIITHRYSGMLCPDGAASAILARDALPDARIVFVSHDDDEYKKLPAEPGMLFIDIVPPESRAQEFVDVGAIVLDHHEKQKETVALFGELGAYADEPGVSGAMLTFRHVWLPLMREMKTSACNDEHTVRALDFAMLAGVRDTWQRSSSHWERACAQAEALAFFPWSTLSAIEDPFYDVGAKKLGALMQLGEVLLEKRAEKTARLIEDAFIASTARTTVLAIIPSTETSDVGDALTSDEEDGAPEVVVGFRYKGGEDGGVSMQLSFRAQGGYDVGALAKSLGGGGHRAASGCSVEIREGDVNPYAFIVALFDAYEGKL